MNTPISVAIPYYSNEQLLLKALHSVEKQTVNPYEVIISLDSKLSDSALNQISKLSLPNLRILENQKAGIAYNWNYCIQNALGDYISLLHSDDELLPNYIEQFQLLIKSAPTCAAYFCGVNVINEHSYPVFSFADWVKQFIRPSGDKIIIEGDSGLASLLSGCYIFCPTVCYQTKIIQDYKFNSRWRMVLDLELYARLIFGGNKLRGINKKLYNYRRHSKSQTSLLTSELSRFQEEIKLYKEIGEQAKKVSWHLSESVARQKIIIKLHLYFQFVKSLFCLRFGKAKKIWSFYWSSFGTDSQKY